ncbi:Zn-dependent oxidoreductase [Agaricicola taiwanensis]|uniref:Zinc-type alcohol dehydrogenase-like protein n=1 Tax=Agaricicola taiwanensis TaxID=591372 RepID=A0A8J2VM44_9RHOB|nr:zinc-binding alcohol dehydrogenase family protein [Agaricicola taiwanensis]GGE37538.1 Zn-dependent oxidoreductase [Agaricicola taiwanensis]
MKAIASTSNQPISHAEALSDVTLPAPAAPEGHDLLVRVQAVSVNPVDTKVRKRAPGTPEAPKVLGYDAAGVVEAVGPEVTLFSPGDEVFYAGDISRPGTNSELHLVDERIVGIKPKTLDFAEAAALPLVSITAWEMLFDRFRITPGGGSGESILIMAGAGGVGSIATQLARRLTRLTVITTASRPETAAFARKMGAHHVIDHSKPMAEQIKSLGVTAPRYIFSITGTAVHFDAYIDIIAPQGLIGVIDDPEDVIDVRKLKSKAAGFLWELMFTRPVQKTADMIEQHRLLMEVSSLVDAGLLVTTLTERVKGINAANLRAVHQKIESGSSIGKTVLEGF